MVPQPDCPWCGRRQHHSPTEPAFENEVRNRFPPARRLPGLVLLRQVLGARQLLQRRGDNVGIALTGPAEDEAELRGYYDKLVEGARSTLPLEKAPWGDYFSMCTDRYGIGWMVNIAGS